MASNQKLDAVCWCVLFYLKNNPVIFHPGPIWNDGAFDYEESRPKKQKKKKKKEEEEEEEQQQQQQDE